MGVQLKQLMNGDISSPFILVDSSRILFITSVSRGIWHHFPFTFAERSVSDEKPELLWFRELPTCYLSPSSNGYPRFFSKNH